jgi:hypothetical protein
MNLIIRDAAKLFLFLFVLPHYPGHGKALSVPFLTFKAGSELLPVRSGAAKLLSFKLSPLYAEHKL